MTTPFSRACAKRSLTRRHSARATRRAAQTSSTRTIAGAASFVVAAAEGPGPNTAGPDHGPRLLTGSRSDAPQLSVDRVRGDAEGLTIDGEGVGIVTECAQGH